MIGLRRYEKETVMKRRQFLVALASASATGPLSAGAQPGPKIARIGLLIPSGLEHPATQQVFGAVRQGVVTENPIRAGMAAGMG